MTTYQTAFDSIEGPRGVGKSTLIHSIQEAAAVQVNREIKKELSPTSSGSDAKRLRGFWHELYRVQDGQLVFDNSEYAEKVAWMKFHHMLHHISLRQEELFEHVDVGKRLIRDRYIDTTVVYDAIDIILSNPSKYADEDSRRALLTSMWHMAISFCELPEKTVYLSTSRPMETLQRSHDSKDKGKDVGAYELDAFQTQSQLLAAQLYPLSFEIRRNLMPDYGIVEVSVDGKSENEVLLEVGQYLNLQHNYAHA